MNQHPTPTPETTEAGRGLHGMGVFLIVAGTTLLYRGKQHAARARSLAMPAPLPAAMSKVAVAIFVGLLALVLLPVMLSLRGRPSSLAWQDTAFSDYSVDTAAEQVQSGLGTGNVAQDAATGLLEQELGGIRMLVPGALAPTAPGIPPEMDSLVASAEAWAWSEGDYFVSVQTSTFRNILNPSLEGAAIGSLDRISKMTGVASFRSERNPTTVSGYPAIRSTAWMTMDGQSVTVRQLQILRDQTLFAIIVVTPDGRDLDEEAEAVVGSVTM